MSVSPLDILIPFALGLIVPFLSRYIKNPDIQSLLNLLLSAAIAAIPTIPQGLGWQDYLLAFGAAWLATLRADATTLPARIYSNRV